MRIFIEKSILIALCFLQDYHEHRSLNIVALLCAYCLALLFDIIPYQIGRYTLLMGYLILLFSVPNAIIYIPLLVYCAVQLSYPWGIVSTLLLIKVQTLWTFTLTALAIYLSIRTLKDTFFQQKSMRILNVLESDKLHLRRQQLQWKNDYMKNLEMATLTERNRIAHHLHDTLGHLISSSILQLEALQIISQETAVRKRLAALSGVMQEGMTDIRQTLHNLYDESFDLEARIEQACLPFQQIDFTLKYAIDSPLELSFKVDILSVIQELVTNWQKHSNATIVHLSIVEQMAFYTITYSDNGLLKQSHYQGIGLLSMQETAQKYNGNLTQHTDNGFGIHITLMKGGDKQDDSNNSY